jgi:hypothetical protein
VSSDELLTAEQAAKLISKTTSNISYLVQYGRIHRYNPAGELVERSRNGELRVSRAELLAYAARAEERLKSRLKALSISDTELAFTDVPERERTKHVHRLHPYLGKFIPQLVEHFLGRYFEAGQTVVDPFCGSGTTLVQAAELGINSIGIEVSAFNALISRVKLATYDLGSMERDVLDIASRTTAFSRALEGKRLRPETDSQYLKRWFAPRSLAEMLYYRDLIPQYEHQDLLRVVLSRTARSCRLTYHYELATPTEPVTGPYVCYKHRNKICRPVESTLKRLRYYSRDTVARISAFSRLRRRCHSIVVEGDSQTVRLDEEVPAGWTASRPVRGVFTSPPYVGQIDYHEQHRYAYELFGLERRDGLEIGPKKRGKGARAREEYVGSLTRTLLNMRRYLPDDALYFVVANDRLSLYPEIFARAGLGVREEFVRPVEDRTERDKRPYSETVFMARAS